MEYAATYTWMELRHYPQRVLLLGLSALAALGVLATPGAINPGLAGMGLLRLFAGIAGFIVVVLLHVSDELILFILTAFLTVQSLVGLGQFIRQSSLGLHILGESYLDPTVVGISVVDAGGHHWLRAYGLFPHPNILGGFLAVGILLIVFVYLADPRRRWPLLFVWSLAVASLVVTFSRSAWLGLLVALGFAIALNWRQGRRPTPALAPILVLSLLVIGLTGGWLQSQIGARFQVEASPLELESVQQRIDLAHTALDIVRQHPWLGIGLENFPLAVPGLAGMDPAVYGKQVPHNGLLLATTELGIAGGGIWLFLWLFPLFLSARRTPTSAGSRWEIGCAAGLLALFVISWFDYYPWGSMEGCVLWGILLALWAKAYRQRELASRLTI